MDDEVQQTKDCRPDLWLGVNGGVDDWETKVAKPRQYDGSQIRCDRWVVGLQNVVEVT